MSARTAKYDRQLRLWAEHGQALLEGARVCLVNGSAAGTETVKNLVLPGVGAFTVVDGRKVMQHDLGSNFFVDAGAVGSSRAKRTTELLQELNEDVQGSFLDESPEQLLEAWPEYFAQFTLVIASELAEAPLLKLAGVCWSHGVPLIVVRTCGLVGYIRIAVPEHTVVESHPDNPISDLRLDCPPQELRDLCVATDMNAMELAQHKHVPFVIVLLKMADRWRREHGGKLPESRAEKDQFKQMIAAAKRGADEANFDEAVAAAHRVWTATTIPSDVQHILSDPKCDAIDANTPNFWILARALRDFVHSPSEGNGHLPVAGTVPDMEADTDSYVRLQTIYRQLAQRDVQAITQRVHSLLQAASRPLDAVSQDEIRLFCKNAYNLRLVRYRSLQEEHAAPRTTTLANALNDPASTLSWYVLLRAADHFEAQFGRYPGELDSADIEGDIPLLKKALHDVLGRLGLAGAAVADEQLHELCRYGASELHGLAAYIGGVASQEALKLLTHQFVPFNNSHVYSGVASTSTTEVL